MQVCSGGLWGCRILCQAQVVVSPEELEGTGRLPALLALGKPYLQYGHSTWCWGGGGTWGPCLGKERSCGCDSLSWEEMGTSGMQSWVRKCVHLSPSELWESCASQGQADGLSGPG